MAINILNESREFSKVEKYLMTVSPDITSMKEIPDGVKITVAGILNFEDVKENGETSEIMSIITPENKVCSCQSVTFKRTINDIAGIMDGKEFTVIKTSGTAKNGRDYINCILDVESLA